MSRKSVFPSCPSLLFPCPGSQLCSGEQPCLFLSCRAGTRHRHHSPLSLGFLHWQSVQDEVARPLVPSAVQMPFEATLALRAAWESEHHPHTGLSAGAGWDSHRLTSWDFQTPLSQTAFLTQGPSASSPTQKHLPLRPLSSCPQPAAGPSTSSLAHCPFSVAECKRLFQEKIMLVTQGYLVLLSLYWGPSSALGSSSGLSPILAASGSGKQRVCMADSPWNSWSPLLNKPDIKDIPYLAGTLNATHTQ